MPSISDYISNHYLVMDTTIYLDRITNGYHLLGISEYGIFVLSVRLSLLVVLVYLSVNSSSVIASVVVALAVSSLSLQFSIECSSY